MRTFLLWRDGKNRPEFADAAAVGLRLGELFAPLFAPRPAPASRSQAGAHLAWIELPVRGWRPPFFQEDEETWAFAPEYPLNARRLLRRTRASVAGGAELPALARALAADPQPLLRELVPPVCLISGDRAGERLSVHNDALGQAQLFEYERGELWALTNRASALRALGVALEPLVPDWATRLAIGWFPGDSTGFRDLRFVRGGTRFTIERRGVRRERCDVIADWIRPAPLDPDECRELARHSLLGVLSDAIENWERPSVGLSGGWDSRAIVACLRALGAEMDLRVRGHRQSYDVLVSAELARIAGLPLRIKEKSGRPPGDAARCRRSIARALLWQSGGMLLLHHKNFLSKHEDERLDGGVVNVMGQHAGIGKADFAVKVAAHEHPPQEYEERLVEVLLRDAPSALRPELLDAVRENVRSAYREAAGYGLAGLGPLHFFFLNEFTRRWASASLASQTGLVVAPFLNPGFIRACYAFPPEELPDKPMHRHITAHHAPDWAGLPYADTLTEEDLRSGLIPAPEPPELRPRARWEEPGRFHLYKYRLYWKQVGRPILDEALARDGFWTTILDPERVPGTLFAKRQDPDVLALLHLLPLVLSGAEPLDQGPQG